MSLNNWWHNWGSVVGKPGTRYSGPLLIYTAGVEEARGGGGLLGRLGRRSRSRGRNVVLAAPPMARPQQHGLVHVETLRPLRERRGQHVEPPFSKQTSFHRESKAACQGDKIVNPIPYRVNIFQ